MWSWGWAEKGDRLWLGLEAGSLMLPHSSCHPGISKFTPSLLGCEEGMSR